MPPCPPAASTPQSAVSRSRPRCSSPRPRLPDRRTPARASQRVGNHKAIDRSQRQTNARAIMLRASENVYLRASCTKRDKAHASVSSGGAEGGARGGEWAGGGLETFPEPWWFSPDATRRCGPALSGRATRVTCAWGVLSRASDCARARVGPVRLRRAQARDLEEMRKMSHRRLLDSRNH